MEIYTILQINYGSLKMEILISQISMKLNIELLKLKMLVQLQLE